MPAAPHDDASIDDVRAPRVVRRSGYLVAGLLLLGAVYLIVVRGEAIVVDLSTLAGQVWCF